METGETPQQRGGGIYNYFEGATIHNLVINGSMTKNGDEHYHGKETTQIPKSAYTDEVIARAIIALDGYKKPLCEKQLFLAIIKVLKYKCGWTERWEAACDRINALPMIQATELDVKCDYNNLKAPSALKFASVDYEEWESYSPGMTENEVFKKNKSVGDVFAEELDRQVKLAKKAV